MSTTAEMDAVPARWLPVLDVLALLSIVAASVALKFALLEPVGPVIFFDEMLYGLASRAMAGEIPYPSGHYPFVYPLFLAPSVLAGAGYDGLFLSNVLASSTLPVACWLLARTVGARLGFPAAACAALLPFNFTFPTQVMAENLFVPAFAFAAWYAVRGRCGGRVASFAYGALLSALFLTKYLALPAAPVLVAIWLIGLHAGGAGRKALASAAAWSGAGWLALTATWLAYAQGQGITVREAFGGNVSGINEGVTLTATSLFMWTCAYLAAFALACGPFLARLLEQAGMASVAPLRYLRQGAYARLVVLTLVLAAGYVLICVQHSAGGAMNHPVPQRVVVRYFMHLVPLVVVIGVCGVVQRTGRHGRWWLAGAAAAVAGVALWHAWQLLYGNGYWEFPHWFAAIPLYATDILAMRDEWQLEVGIFLAVVSLLVARIPLVRWLFLVAVLLWYYEGTTEVSKLARKETAVTPLHARAVAPLVLRDIGAGHKVLILHEIPRLGIVDLKQGLVFWGADVGRIVVAEGSSDAGLPQGVTSAYRITPRERPDLEVVATYPLGNRTGHVYREDIERLARQKELPALQQAPATAEAMAPCALAAGNNAATLEWDFTSGRIGGVSIYIVGASGTERLFAQGGAAGTTETGKWVAPTMAFRFRDVASGKLLKEVATDYAACEGSGQGP